METVKKNEDRRIQRTRQALQKAFKEVLREKGFAATTIQDITERANVNRGTFYIHFADKYALTSAIIRQNFQQHLDERLPPDPGWNRRTLGLLIRAVLDNFEGKYHHRPVTLNVPASLFEQAMREELTNLLETWLKQAGVPETAGLAQVVGWSIFGPALEWSQQEEKISADQMTELITGMLCQGLPGFSAPARNLQPVDHPHSQVKEL